MTLRFTVFGFELARVSLDIEHTTHPEPIKALEHLAERGVKAMSKAWVKRMIAT